MAGVESEVTGDHGRGYRARYDDRKEVNKLTKQLPKGGEDDLERVLVTQPVEDDRQRDLYVMRLNLTVNDREQATRYNFSRSKHFRSPRQTKPPPTWSRA